MPNRLRTTAHRLVRGITRAPQPLTFDDSVGSWQAAQQASSGYDQALILDRVRSSTEQVIAGQAAYERDGVTFTDPEIRQPVADALTQSAAVHGDLRVLDIGGSLGSVYWQQRPAFAGLDVHWTIIEQPSYVAAGNSLTGHPLRFFPTIEEAHGAGPWHLALFSSALQYLENPWQALADVMETGVDCIVIDRTPMHAGATDIPTIQHVPPHIYPAAYPAWILSEVNLARALQGWRIIDTFPGIEPDMRTSSGVHFHWSGCIALRESA